VWPAQQRRRLTRPLLIVAGTLALVVGGLSSWLRHDAFDTRYAATASGKMLEDGRIRQAVSLEIVAELYRDVDVEAEIRSTLPANLRPSAPPAAAAIRLYAPWLLEQILRLPFVVSAWEDAAAIAQRAFLRLVNGDAGEYSNIYLSVRPVLLQAAARLGIERPVAARLPANPDDLPLFRGDTLFRVRQGLALTRWLSRYAVLAAVACYCLALWLARGRRRDTLLRIGVAVSGAGLILLAVRKLAGPFVVDSVLGSRQSLEPAGMDAWRILGEPLSPIVWTTIATGLLAYGLAILAGHTRSAMSTRARLAPVLVERPAIAWGAIAFSCVLLAVLMDRGSAFSLVALTAIIVLLVAGTELLRRVTVQDQREHVDGPARGESLPAERRSAPTPTPAVARR
jgi:hypothetical protein